VVSVFCFLVTGASSGFCAGHWFLNIRYWVLDYTVAKSIAHGA
jgi:hypothetical protein